MHGQGHLSNPNVQRGDAALVGESKKKKEIQTTESYPWKPPICSGCNQPGHFRCDCPKANGTKKRSSHEVETAGEEPESESWCICGIKE